jgi:hypothetical protein
MFLVFDESYHEDLEFTVSMIPGVCVVGEDGEGGLTAPMVEDLSVSTGASSGELLEQCQMWRGSLEGVVPIAVRS